MLFTGAWLYRITIVARKGKKISICEIIQDNRLEFGEVRRIPCRPQTVGRFVRLTQNLNVEKYLVICELEVYGTNGMQYSNIN